MRLTVPAMLLFLAVPVSLAAQETRPIPDDFEPPAAQLSEFSWMVGQWEGSGVSGNLAVESWLPPTGNTMVGTFVQTDAGGNIQFSEHMYLMEDDGTVVLRLKHFNADLTGWEERDDMTSFRLLSVEPCAAYFGGLTIRCEGDSGLLVAVRMRSSAGAVSELVFDFERQRPLGSSPCPEAATTLDMNDCYSAILTAAEERRAQYLLAATERYSGNAELQQQIETANAAYSDYVDAECGAVYDYWRSGTIRGVMSLTCRINLVDRGTHNLWQHWLTYMDSSPPLLAEPEPML